MRARRELLAAITAVAAVVLPVALPFPSGAEADRGTSVPAPRTSDLTASPPPAGTTATKRHMEQLQKIADANGGTRASGTPGYDASAAYVAEKLRSAGYQVTEQNFEFPYFRDITEPVFNRVSPEAKTYTRKVDFRTMTYSGSGNVTAPVEGVDLVLPPTPRSSSTSGCEESDFAGFTRGNIALIQRGACSFQIKAELAQAAGASGVIFFNEGQPDRIPDDRVGLLSGTLGAPTTRIPVVGTTFGVGEELSAAGTTVTLTTNTEGDPHRKTRNVLAESRWGDPNKVVMIGAHLDSVVDGPGINDNGSGTAGVLETALTTSGTQTTNRLRFAFWGAEELGLLGSKHYVGALTPTEQDKIKMYLNFDMIASPNHFLGIYDGDNSDAVGASAGPPGSDKIEKFFEDHFARSDLPYLGTDFTGRSDYGPFIGVGIPSGGLFTGAEGIKTPSEAAAFGGRAGVAYDECYHKACDTIANLNDRALEANASAITAAALAYGRSAHLPGGNTTVTSAPVVSKRGGAAVKHGPDNDHTDVPR
ncbi:M28 family peptidase [Streptosporangium lutulentum]|uniref:Aminopeptidase Y n=1 Tax=Streptosporangium lutulentum TaxID=1461250 RepID=A0ABT9QNX4_9ACTN|nr:M28 family peptidase [Streptosporangium lutulentum]MDP9848446.1 aminopeptidase Y [Streptosporangium lutulentum]